MRDPQSHCDQTWSLTLRKSSEISTDCVDCDWIAAAVGVGSARTKDGFDVPVSVNYDSEEYQEELKLSEPLLWDIMREFPEDAQKAGMKKEMDSMREFNVYTDIPIEHVSE